MNRRHFFQVTIVGLVATWPTAKPAVSVDTFPPGEIPPRLRDLADHFTPLSVNGCVLTNTTHDPIQVTILDSVGRVLCEPIVAAQSYYEFVIDSSMLPLSIISGSKSIRMTTHGHVRSSEGFYES